MERRFPQILLGTAATVFAIALGWSLAGPPRQPVNPREVASRPAVPQQPAPTKDGQSAPRTAAPLPRPSERPQARETDETGTVARPPTPVPAPAGTPKAPPPPADTPAPASAARPNAITGKAEVIDTTTIRIDRNVLPLYGVEWARGGRSEELAAYLGDRPVNCEAVAPAQTYRCTVEGKDLSRAVLYNGGAKASAAAPPELRLAEDHAKTQRLGVWQADAP
jgi:hypothetical protein